MAQPAGRSVDARCPFYRKDTATTVSCEGITDRGTLLLRFPNAKDCSIQFDTFCGGFYWRCELDEAIMKAKYLD